MKYYKFTADTPYCGTENDYYMSFDDDVTEQTLDECAEDFRNENANSFEYLVHGWDADPVGDGDMTEEEYEQSMEDYRADCTCEYWEISESEYRENGGR